MIMDMIRRSDVISAIEKAKARSTFATDNDYTEYLDWRCLEWIKTVNIWDCVISAR